MISRTTTTHLYPPPLSIPPSLSPLCVYTSSSEVSLSISASSIGGGSSRRVNCVCVSDMTKITINYLPVRALGEPLRMLCAMAEIEYTNYTFDDNLMNWGKKSQAEKSEWSPTEQMPTLVIESDDGKTTLITQSGACMRYLAQLAGGSMWPADPLERAKVDIVFELAQEMFLIQPICNIWSGDMRAEKEKAFFDDAFARRLRFCERTLTDDFFAGSAPSYGDIQMFHYLDLALLAKPTCLDDAPKTKAFVDKMKALPAIATYLTERPQIGSQKIGKPGSYTWEAPRM